MPIMQNRTRFESILEASLIDPSSTHSTAGTVPGSAVIDRDPSKKLASYSMEKPTANAVRARAHRQDDAMARAIGMSVRLRAWRVRLAFRENFWTRESSAG
jgi:hypothetical protein